MNYRYYDLVMALFVTVLLISNVLSSAKIVDLKTALGRLHWCLTREHLSSRSVTFLATY